LAAIALLTIVPACSIVYLKAAKLYNTQRCRFGSDPFLALLIDDVLMTALQLTVQYPDTSPDATGLTREQFEEAARCAMAVKLFELKQLSSGVAAALIGVDRVTFLLKLGDYGVPVINLTEAELRSDLANA